MEENKDLFSKVRRWFSGKPELERMLRLISPAFVYGALDERLTFSEALNKALGKKLPNYSVKRTLCMGGIALFLFVNQVITGTLLCFYYEQSTEAAYSSVQYIDQQVPVGFLIRQMHAWGGFLMVLFVLFHMTKVFLNKAYRPPRELTWITGSLLLFITLTFGITGILLPWSQSAYWSSIYSTNLLGSVPLVGGFIMTLMYAGNTISELTISRFFALHAVILPWVTTGILVLHFMIIRRLGISEPL